MLAPPTPDEIRAASRCFPRGTSSTVEGFHVSHFALLPDAALRAWSLLWAAIERAGLLPGQVGQVVIPHIPKPDGGLRPIGASRRSIGAA